MGIMNGKSSKQDYEELIKKYDLYNIDDQKTLKEIICMLNNFDNIKLGQVQSNDPCLRTIVEQNWMIIKLLDNINKKLEK